MQKFGLLLALTTLSGIVLNKANHTTVWYIGLPLVILGFALLITAFLVMLEGQIRKNVKP